MLKKTKPVKTHISVVKAKLAKARKVGKFSKKTKQSLELLPQIQANTMGSIFYAQNQFCREIIPFEWELKYILLILK